jgi:ABC-2 type transport system permease protein
MFRVEIAKSIRRVRTWVFAAGLAALAILPVVFLPDTSSGGDGPPFLEFISRSGLFAGLTAVALIQPFFLPLGTGLLAGESIAGEASNGTLRYLVVRPVGRTRLVLAKYGAVMAQVGAAVLWVLIVGLVAGTVAFGVGDLPTLSGTTLGAAAGIARIALAAAYVFVGVAGLAAIGVFFSSLTDSGPGATVATVAVAIGSQVLDNLSALRAVHPYLLSHGWLAFVDLFRSPVDWSGILQGLALAAAYTAVFLAAALYLFGRKDVVS